jgi:hypothetical protein
VHGAGEHLGAERLRLLAQAAEVLDYSGSHCRIGRHGIRLRHGKANGRRRKPFSFGTGAQPGQFFGSRTTGNSAQA